MVSGDGRCPSCDAIIERGIFARSACAMAFMGVMLAGCPADDTNDSVGDESSATAPTASATMTAATESDTTADDTTGPPDQPLYGVAETTSTTTPNETTGSTSGTDTDATTGTTTAGETTGPAPAYGIAEN